MEMEMQGLGRWKGLGRRELGEHKHTKHEKGAEKVLQKEWDTQVWPGLKGTASALLDDCNSWHC